MQAHFVGGYVRHGTVHGVDRHAQMGLKIGPIRRFAPAQMRAERHVRGVKLQCKACIDNGLIFGAHRFGGGVQIGFVRRIILVRKVERDLTGRDSRYESILPVPAIQRGGQVVDVAVERVGA